jgi:2-keto-3-deoxy-L-rhamnonate aldolase RhmA
MQVGKPCGMVVGSVEQAKSWIDFGFNFLICGQVSGMVRQQTRTLAKGIQDSNP